MLSYLTSDWGKIVKLGQETLAKEHRQDLEPRLKT
jgi:hypothetical protein